MDRNDDDSDVVVLKQEKDSNLNEAKAETIFNNGAVTKASPTSVSLLNNNRNKDVPTTKSVSPDSLLDNQRTSVKSPEILKVDEDLSAYKNKTSTGQGTTPITSTGSSNQTHNKNSSTAVDSTNDPVVSKSKDKLDSTFVLSKATTEVVENEIIAKKETCSSGKDDNLIEEWKKAEKGVSNLTAITKRSPEDVLDGLMGEIVGVEESSKNDKKLINKSDSNKEVFSAKKDTVVSKKISAKELTASQQISLKEEIVTKEDKKTSEEVVSKKSETVSSENKLSSAKKEVLSNRNDNSSSKEAIKEEVLSKSNINSSSKEAKKEVSAKEEVLSKRIDNSSSKESKKEVSAKEEVLSQSNINSSSKEAKKVSAKEEVLSKRDDNSSSKEAKKEVSAKEEVLSKRIDNSSSKEAKKEVSAKEKIISKISINSSSKEAKKEVSAKEEVLSKRDDNSSSKEAKKEVSAKEEVLSKRNDNSSSKEAKKEVSASAKKPSVRSKRSSIEKEAKKIKQLSSSSTTLGSSKTESLKKKSASTLSRKPKKEIHQPSEEEKRLEIEQKKAERLERIKKREEERKLKDNTDIRSHQHQLATAMRKLKKKEGHDSGVDESTQSKDGSVRTRPRDGRITPKKRHPRSVDPSPMKSQSRQSAQSVERKLPMNKIEVGKSASPQIKGVRSKIGSLDNATHKPRGGSVKIESKKLDFTKASSRVAAKNETYSPGGGDKKIESQKLQWNVSSKVGSMDKKAHKAGGGDKKIVTQKLNFGNKAQSKVGSKDNMKHKAGGGDVEIQTEKLTFKNKAASKIGSLENVKHKAGGGSKKIFEDKEYMRQIQSVSGSQMSGKTSEAVSPATTGTNSPGPQVGLVVSPPIGDLFPLLHTTRGRRSSRKAPRLSSRRGSASRIPVFLPSSSLTRREDSSKVEALKSCNSFSRSLIVQPKISINNLESFDKLYRSSITISERPSSSVESKNLQQQTNLRKKKIRHLNRFLQSSDLLSSLSSNLDSSLDTNNLLFKDDAIDSFSARMRSLEIDKTESKQVRRSFIAENKCIEEN